MKFLLLHYLDERAVPDARDPDVTEERELDAWVAAAEASGEKLFGGHLRPSRDGRVVRVRDDELLVSDGPYAETKEQIAGFDVLECASLQDAIELAARHPTARTGTFELRPFWD